MQFHTLAIRISTLLAIATALSLQSLSVATTKSDLIQPLEPQPDAPQAVVLQAQRIPQNLVFSVLAVVL